MPLKCKSENLLDIKRTSASDTCALRVPHCEKSYKTYNFKNLMKASFEIVRTKNLKPFHEYLRVVSVKKNQFCIAVGFFHILL